MDWQELLALTQGRPFVVERIRLADQDVAVEGRFEPPQLAQLVPDDQVFITAFVRCHGSIKEMERIFGVSYPTIKSRLNRIAQGLEFVAAEVVETEVPDPAPAKSAILDRLRSGDISAADAIRELKNLT
jgi:hypothetical protein